MIKITVELLPHGKEEGKKTIGEMKIWNDGSGTPWLGSYGFDIKHGRKGFIGEFKRTKHNVWWLVAACLGVAIPTPETAFRDGVVRSKVAPDKEDE